MGTIAGNHPQGTIFLEELLVAESEGSKTLPVLLALLALAALGALWYFFARSGDAQVSGKVTLDSAPVSGALVVFLRDGGPGQGPGTARSDEQGSYRLLGNTGGGVPPGKYKVVVTKEALKDGTVPQGERLEQARTQGLLVNVLPSKYEGATTPLVFELKAGSNTVDLELKK